MTWGLRLYRRQSGRCHSWFPNCAFSEDRIAKEADCEEFPRRLFRLGPRAIGHIVFSAMKTPREGYRFFFTNNSTLSNILFTFPFI